MVSDTRQRRSRRASGFTLLEVMIAVAILTITTGAVMAGFAGLVGVRRESNDVNTINALLRDLDNRIQGASPEDILSANTWLRPRPALAADNTIATIDSNNGPLDDSSLIALGLLDGEGSGINGLAVYIEYYRGLRTISDPVSGRESLDTLPPYAQMLSNPAFDWQRTLRTPHNALTTTAFAKPPSPTAYDFLIPSLNPVPAVYPALNSLNRDSDWHLVIRLIVVWKSQSGQAINGFRSKELITGRRIPRID